MNGSGVVHPTTGNTVSIAFRLNVRLRADATASGTATASTCLNCLSAECSIESQSMTARDFTTARSSLNCLSAECSIESFEARSGTGEQFEDVSIAFRLNVRLRVKGTGNYARACFIASLNCLSAECSIERTWSSSPWTRPSRPCLNCLSAECSIESTKDDVSHDRAALIGSQLPFG